MFRIETRPRRPLFRRIIVALFSRETSAACTDERGSPEVRWMNFR